MAAERSATRKPGRTPILLALTLVLAAVCLVGAYLVATSDSGHPRVTSDRRVAISLDHRHHIPTGRLTKATTLTIEGVTLRVPAGWYVSRTDVGSMTSNELFLVSSAPLERSCSVDDSCVVPYVHGQLGATTVTWLQWGAPTVPFHFNCRIEGVPAFVSVVSAGRASNACSPSTLARGGRVLVAFRPAADIVIEASAVVAASDRAVLRMITTARVSAGG